MGLELRESCGCAPLKLKCSPCEHDHSMELSSGITIVSNDYEKLRNKPTLNGEEILGDMNESDPTVPAWAKKSTKPDYNYDEVAAVGAENALTIAEIKAMVDLFDPR